VADNKAILQRFYDEAVNGGNLDLIDELIAEDLVEHDEFPGLEPNRDGVKQLFAATRRAFPDFHVEAERYVEEGDLTVGWLRFSGTHQGEFLGIEPTGNQINVTAVDMARFRDGRIVEHWGLTDAMSMMQQLGAIPAPAG
jgi:steroid delta-isomerase-like uncharacterized protein